jgi:hypothetical protein
MHELASQWGVAVEIVTILSQLEALKAMEDWARTHHILCPPQRGDRLQCYICICEIAMCL